MISLGKELRKARVDKALTQQALSAKTGIAQKHISALESDQMMPKWPTLVKLALELDLHLDTLAWEWSRLPHKEVSVGS